MSIIFGGRRSGPAAVPADSHKPATTIGPASTLRGTLEVEGALRLDGLVEGSVTASGNVIVSKTARVTAAITGNNILVAGVVRGNIVARGRLEIVASGRVFGDINVQALLIEEGGVLHGQSQMPDEHAPDTVLDPTPVLIPGTDAQRALS